MNVSTLIIDGLSYPVLVSGVRELETGGIGGNVSLSNDHLKEKVWDKQIKSAALGVHLPEGDGCEEEVTPIPLDYIDFTSVSGDESVICCYVEVFPDGKERSSLLQH